MKNLKKGDTLKLKDKNPRCTDIIEGEYLATKVVAGKEVLMMNFKFSGTIPCIKDRYEIIKN